MIFFFPLRALQSVSAKSNIFLISGFSGKAHNFASRFSLALQLCSPGLSGPAQPQVDRLSAPITLTWMVGYGNWEALQQRNYRLFRLR